MKPLAMITLFTVSISAIEWGLLQVVVEEKIYREEKMQPLAIPLHQHLQYPVKFIRHQAQQVAFAKHQLVTKTRYQKSSGGTRYDGRTSCRVVTEDK